MIVNHSKFLDLDVEGKDIENSLLLGPFFKVSTLNLSDARVMQNFRDEALERPSEKAKTAIISYRNTLHGVQSCLYEMLLKLLKPVVTRPKTLLLLAFILNSNKKRSQSHGDRRLMASDSFFVNFSCSMLKLCDPFLIPASNNFSKIDINYLSKPSCKLNVTEETRLRMTKEELESHMKTFANDSSQPKFCYGMLLLHGLCSAPWNQTYN